MSAKSPEPTPPSSAQSVPAPPPSAQPAPARPADATTASQPVAAAGPAAKGPAADTPAAADKPTAASKPTATDKPTATPKATAPKAAPVAAARPPRRTRAGAGSGAGATVTSVLALLVALGALGVAVYALDTARGAKSQNAPTMSRPVAPATSAPAAAAPTATAPPTPAAPRFAPERPEVDLVVPPANGCQSVYVDVDALQVGIAAGHEFYLSRCLGPYTVRVDRRDAAVAVAADATPETCASELTSAPGAPEIVFDVRQGLSFCLLTSAEDARVQGIPQRLAIVELIQVTADETVTAAVRTFRMAAGQG
jgi:hypothetical protein